MAQQQGTNGNGGGMAWNASQAKAAERLIASGRTLADKMAQYATKTQEVLAPFCAAGGGIATATATATPKRTRGRKRAGTS